MKDLKPRRRGRPATGVGVPIHLRLDEELYEALEMLASAAAVSRPEVIRHVISLWAESMEIIDHAQDSQDRAVSTTLSEKVFVAFSRARDEEFPGSIDRGAAFACIIEDWLRERNYLPSQR